MQHTSKVVWGIIGCGDVAEVKSGPAFQKLNHSELHAVMRRNTEKAQDFASRHQVPKWYNNADELLKNEYINSIYIATPPSTHLEYTIRALEAGKNVYLEKPMALSYKQAKKITAAVEKYNSKLTLAHYRRHLPAFLKARQLLNSEVIGEVRFADIQVLQPIKSALVADSETNWRVDSAISGGGYFHDLAPHQIDLMCYFFGPYDTAHGFSAGQDNTYKADDIVNGIISFQNGVQCRGVWCFNTAEENKKESCIIYGSKGRIEFSFFGDVVKLIMENKTEEFRFKNIPQVQQPMIARTIGYFLGKESNPCSSDEGLQVAKIMDIFCGISVS
ncbi:Gfo/Idh/MocA family oxidoreductase [Gramella sp. AN32]|uniref:Gfo/Idh/MocA family protein n=1 Tax=Christiangramia antarctica TaxID=2058158 RepID=A0ABW5X7G5_9FLAO|nr:Gfo/Idh/MocA family oxidoreductase [Gramella sp. AN32]MCM4154846.1 oxidoreductase [Gramella sp. AN32]